MKDKALIVGDLHITLSKLSWFNNSFFPFLLSEMEKHECTHLVLLGDIFDDREAVPTPCLECFIDFLTKTSGKFIVACVKGNHDYWTYSKAESLNLEMINGYVKSLGYDGMIFDYFKFNNTDCHLINYDEIHKTRERLQKIENRKSYIFGHNTTEVCNIAKKSEDYIKYDDLYDFKYCFFGHIHNYSENSNIIHLPSVYQHDFGEDHYKFIVLMEQDHIETSHIEIPIEKRLVSIHIDKKVSKSELENILSENGVKEGDSVRIVAKMKKSEFDEIGYLFSNFKVKKDFQMEENTISEKRVFEKTDILEEIKKYIEQNSQGSNVEKIIQKLIG